MAGQGRQDVSGQDGSTVAALGGVHVWTHGVCVCVYVCMHVCMYVCMYVRMWYVYEYVCVYEHECVCVSVCRA